jgi:PAS domain S-box-containing protein/diguanylate cyclase (GGDEF)-like protein
VVLLEGTGGPAQPLSAAQVRSLQEALELGRPGGAIRAGDRYALQVTATGAGPVEALLEVVARWAAAVHDLGLPPSRLIRTEVFTPEDLDREFEESDREWPRREPRVAAPRPAAGDDSDELLLRAFSDPLTGLLGREAFVRQVEVTLTRFDAVAVVCLDLDRFRGASSVLGGAARDEVMLGLARRLGGMLRAGDALARIGADAFGILLAAGEEAGLVVARRLIAAARTPIGVSGGDVIVSASAGVAGGRRGESGPLIIANAEAALAAARPGGSEPFAYGLEMSPPAEVREAIGTPVLQDPLANVQLLQRAAVAAYEADTLEQAAQVVVREVGNHVSSDVSQVWVSPAALDADRPSAGWRLISSSHPTTHHVAEDFLAGPVVGLAGRVFSTRRPAWMPHISADDEGSGGLRSAFAFPVTVGSEVVAVLAFFSCAHMEPSGSFEDVVTGIAAQLGRLVERQRAAAVLRRYAEELRASEALLREARFAGRIGSWYIDLRSGTTTMDGLRELYGIDPAETLEGESLLSLVDPRDRDHAEAAFSRLARTGEPTTDEIRIRDGSGQMRWLRVQGSAVRDDNDQVVAIYGTGQDVTEARQAQEELLDRERQLAEARRRAAEELRSSKALYQRIVETTREGIVTVDAENRITFVNARLGQLLGYGVDEMTGMAATSLLGPIFDALLTGHPGRRRERLSEHYEAHLRAKDGATLHALLSVSPFVNDGGEYTGALAMVSDITAVRDAEAILRQSARNLAEIETGRPRYLDLGAGE